MDSIRAGGRDGLIRGRKCWILLSDRVVYRAVVEVSVYGGDADPRQVLLVFGEDIDTAALQAHIETELGAEFLPDRIECLPLLPKRNAEGGADQEWCQFALFKRRALSAAAECGFSLFVRVEGDGFGIVGGG